MKKVLVYSSVVLMLLAGCSSKTPAIDETQGADSSQMESAADADTVVVDENAGVSDSTIELGEETMSALERQMLSIYFAFDKFDISMEASTKLQTNAALMQNKAAAFNIKIEGNCDEWGSDEYNFALGLKRAKAAKDALVAEGVNAERISMVSYGESNPVCVEKTQECWAKNRRDDFKLLP
ncbi:peptidoglycan-associated lipoprotein Pal [Sulfurimonas sp. HSL-1656]|uniref:peptidoglycan-associated lipoprotein Pal n=1 Tax=Thiomicrolovo subterrani TaxID=3131934 RepID=UPI0031F81663